VSTPLCPRCQVPLAPLGVATGRAHGCGRCAGVLLDDAAFGHVRASAYQSVLASGREPPPTSADGDYSPVLPCPVCRTLMTRSRIGEVCIDVCASHGVWFDRDELLNVAQVIAVARGATGREQRPSLSPRDREELARTVASEGFVRAAGAAAIQSALQPPAKRVDVFDVLGVAVRLLG
jgi:Zn-finger nucleic acid-binding protein